MAEIKVTVFKPKGRKYFQAQWVDPITGKKKTRSTGTNLKREAERFAGKLAGELNSGTYRGKLQTKWSDFRERYESEVVPGFADRTAEKVRATFRAVERIINPKMLATLNGEQISRLTSELRKQGLAEPTIKSHLAHLKSALRWAKDIGILTEVPKIIMPKRTAGMKGRPITTEEFERMIDTVPKVVGRSLRRNRTRLICKLAKVPGPEVAIMQDELRHSDRTFRNLVESWRRLLWGLWWSGLRLGEAVRLHWTDDRELTVDFSGKYPMFRIRAEAEKGHKDRLLPMAPEFAEFLEAVPNERREGFVFDQLSVRDCGQRLTQQPIGSMLCEIGKVANIKVAENKKGRVKFASAHDCRRAFGFRWSQRVMPPILQQMMRHESIQTTMTYYVGKNAATTAEVIWSSLANSLANTSVKSKSPSNEHLPQTSTENRLE